MNTKLSHKFFILAVILASLWLFSQAQAQVVVQQGRIDNFTFFIPYDADQLDAQFDAGIAYYDLIGADIQTTISIAVNRDDTIIFYDHWEDGLEADLTAPTQATTRIWGDGDDTNNGPGVTLPPGDILTAGTVILLQNLVELDAAGGRDPAQIFFDGGDNLTASGGSIAVSLGVWPVGGTPIAGFPLNPGRPGILYAGAWELYPTAQWGLDYLIPVGEDLEGTGPNQRPGFAVVGFNVQAVADDTTISIDLKDGSPAIVATLDRGESFPVISGANVGAEIQVTNGGPVQVHVFTSDTDPEFPYEARAYTIVPADQWSDEYIAPRSSDGDFWLYNPNDNAITVTVDTSSGPQPDLSITANTTIKYPASGLSSATGVHFSSTAPFYGLAALDQSFEQDWGYALQPAESLSTQMLVGWGVGNAPGGDINNPPNGNESPVYVTALAPTTVTVIYADGSSQDFAVGALEEVVITAPNNDMTGAFLFTQDGTPFVSVWGQDQTAPVADPSIDLGTSIVPIQSLALLKEFHLVDEADCSGSISEGDTIEFALSYFNNTAAPIANLRLSDDLPPELSYVSNSTRLNGVAVPDNAGNIPLPIIVGTVDAQETGALTFETIVNNGTSQIINQATADADLLIGTASDSVTVLVPTGSTTPLLEFDSQLDPADGSAGVGDTVTATLTISNTSGSDILNLPLELTYNNNHLSFGSASPTPDNIGTGLLSWIDLTGGTGLPDTEAVSATVSFSIDQIPPGNSTIIRATALEVELGNNQAPLTCHTDTSLTVASPPSGDGDDKDDDDDTPATATPVAAAPVATPAPELPVAFLPETGLNEMSQNGLATGAVLLLSGLVLGLGTITLYLRRRSSDKNG